MYKTSSGDWFLDLFVEKAEKLIERLGSATSLHRELGVMDYSWWISGLPEPLDKDTTIAAVDGGGGIQPVSNGGAIYVVRAYGYIPGDEPVRMLELDYYPVREARLLDAMRSVVELSTVLEVLGRIGRGSVLLVDGSLWALLSSSLSAVLRAARRRVLSIGFIYTALYSARALSLLREAVLKAYSRGVVMAFISKDHSYSILKETVLLDMLKDSSLEPRVLEGALSWYPIANREELYVYAKKVKELGKIVEAILDKSYRDTVFIEGAGVGQAGYTKAIRIPPPRSIASYISSRGVKNIVESISRKAEEHLLRGQNILSYITLTDLYDVLDKLPSSTALYIKLSAHDAPLLVELPLLSPDYYSPGRSLEEPSPTAVRALQALVTGYGGPHYYNTSLVVAHVNATLRSRQLNYYMRILEELASSYGVKLPLPRRLDIHYWTKS